MRFFARLKARFAFLAYAASHKRFIVLRRIGKALGDNLMLSTAAREIKKTYPDLGVVIETQWPELFENNPNVDLVLYGKVAKRFHKIPYKIDPSAKADERVHILDQIIMGLPLKIDKWERRVDLFLDDAKFPEIEKKLPREFIAFCPQGKQLHSANRKDWGTENFEALLKLLPEIKFVQIGQAKDRLLEGAVDMRGLDILSSACVIKRASACVFLEGGLMHVANAVRTPAVVIYGCVVPPEVSRYDDQLAVVSSVECGPCFTNLRRMEDCGTMRCMKMIKPETVADLIRRGAYQKGGVVIVK